MGYIGKPPEQGRYGKLDQISSGFNGSTATFNLTVDSEAVYPVNPQALIISLNGVIQQPGTDYTVSAATITFTTNPASGVGFFGVILGDSLDVGTPSDGSVTVAKMAANSVDSAQYVDGSIDLVHMSAESVDSNQYVDGSIDRIHLAADIIDGTKIDDASINSEHYVNASIDTAHIGNLQITNALMADDAIGVAELSATGTASSSTFLRGDNAWAAAGGALSSTIVVGSRTASEGSGTEAITGAGFAPTAVIIFAVYTNSQQAGSWGFGDDAAGERVTFIQQDSTPSVRMSHNDGAIMWCRIQGSTMSASLTSLDSDGATFAFTKSGDGFTITYKILFLR